MLVVPIMATVVFSSVSLSWEPVQSREYCESLPTIYVQGAERDSSVSGKNMVCTRLVGPSTSKSPDEWLDTVRGKLKGGSSTCTGSKCDGEVEILFPDDAMSFELKFQWTAGKSDYSLKFYPPVGLVEAAFTLYPKPPYSCIQTQPYTETLATTCSLIAEDDFYGSEGFITFGSNALKASIEIYTSRSGVAASLPSIGISCQIDTSRISKECLNASVWEYSFSDALTSTAETTRSSNAENLHKEMKNEEGVSLSYVNTNGKSKLAVISTDVCDLDSQDVCLQNNPPCAWDASKQECYMDKFTSYNPVSGTKTLVQGSNNTVEIRMDPWGPSFLKVLKIFYTISDVPGNDPSPSSVGSGTSTCTPPCLVTLVNGTHYIASRAYISSRSGNLYSGIGRGIYTILAPDVSIETPAPPSSDSAPTGLIIGVVVAGVATLAAVVGLVVWARKGGGGEDDAEPIEEEMFDSMN
eukprot:TRINITY_DN1961_c8_g1_i1.p1 TRINITY_DN1961_c8_g1~~TRINITY_DN1961_c8_g1_i1.p1  ORF type:complete len:487 (+),score=67.13 TRINITY_DN1961_c8_g1_i1:61-1461(+)